MPVARADLKPENGRSFAIAANSCDEPASETLHLFGPCAVRSAGRHSPPDFNRQTARADTRQKRALSSASEELAPKDDPQPDISQVRRTLDNLIRFLIIRIQRRSRMANGDS